MSSLARYLLVAVSLCALAVATACDGRLAYRSDESHRTPFRVPAGTKTLRVEVPWGAMTFRAAEDGELMAVTRTRRAADTEAGLEKLMELDVALHVVPDEPGVLCLEGADVPDGLDPVAHRLITISVIHVPPGLTVEGKTGFGAMAGYGLTSGVSLATGHGDLFLKDCAGHSVLRTGGGAVLVDHYRGSIDAESEECQTMQIFVDELGEAGLRLVTGRGGIQAHVPADASFVLDAVTNLGKARNSFGIPVEMLPPSGDRKAMRGTVGGGGPTIFIEAREEGNVSIRGLTKKG